MISRMKIGINPDTFEVVSVKPDDRFKHAFCLGKTGSGKSVWLLVTWTNDSHSLVAKILIDPSGFLAGDAYSAMKGKAHYCSLETPISLNPMVSPYKPHQIADIVADTINQMITITTPNQTFTVKMRELLDDAIIYCLSHNQYTLDEVKAYLEAQRGNGETRDGIIARLNFLLQDPDFKQLICGQSSFEINRLIENQESLILDCSGMGFNKKVFIGALLTNLVKSYFIYAKPKEYQPLIMTVDECHNFVSPDFSLILKEGRKYKISTILATTDFSSMPSSLIHAIRSNVGTIICLRAGYIEASMISNEFVNGSSQDILGLEKYHALVKTPDGECIVKLPRPPFIRNIPVKPMEKKKPVDHKWFDLDPTYSFHLTTISNDVAGS